MSTSIVIPTYGRWDLLHQLLFDLYKNCSLIEEVIIVNDKPDEKDVRNGLIWWKSTNMLPIEVVETPENLGFLRASNLGLKRAIEDNVILISTDVRVHKDIIQEINNPNFIYGGKLLDWDTGWNVFNGKVYRYLEGWILAADKRAWKELDYFDERFAPNDYEDIDFSTKAIEHNFILGTFPEGYVSHLGSQSIPYGDERETGTKINKKKFEEKWSQH